MSGFELVHRSLPCVITLGIHTCHGRAGVILEVRYLDIVHEGTIAICGRIHVWRHAPAVVHNKLEPMRAWREVDCAQKWCLRAQLAERNFALPFVSKCAGYIDAFSAATPNQINGRERDIGRWVRGRRNGVLLAIRYSRCA